MRILIIETVAFFPDFFSLVDAPRISTTSDASARRGSHAWLKCKAVYPRILTTPTTFWLFNNTRLAKESQHYQSEDDGPRMGPNRTKLLSLQLHISNVSAKDVGWYTCGVDLRFTLSQQISPLVSKMRLLEVRLLTNGSDP